MMEFEVAVSVDAENDLAAIYNYIAEASGTAQAVLIQDKLMDEILSLEKLPTRGKCPPELQAAGVTEFYEVQCSPWRIFYYISKKRVGVIAVLDGRRNVAQILTERLTDK